MKQPVPITVSVALSDKEYSYPSWMRSQSIASPPPSSHLCPPTFHGQFAYAHLSY